MDALGNILILGIGLASVGFGKTTSPAKLGVVLTYALSIVSSFFDSIPGSALVLIFEDFRPSS
jgi:hypothetical protein